MRSLRDVNRQAFLLCLGTGCAACAFAQTSATGSDLPQSGEFEYPSVAAALTALMARSDVDRIYRGDGWPGFTDDKNNIIWAFAPRGHPAYPAVVKRVISGDGNQSQISTTAKCEAAKSACDKLMSEFSALDRNAGEYVKFMGKDTAAPGRSAAATEAGGR